ncbi:MAG: hypothetical protein WCJ61_05895 [Paludibacter sp.]
MTSYNKYKQLFLRNLYKKEFCITIICIGIIVKLVLFPFKLGDYNVYLEPWINFIKNHGYEKSLKFNFYNYAPSYIYLLITIAKIGLNPLYSIKIVSILFEYILAFYIGKIANLKYNNNIYIWISLAILPIVPTVLLNGAFWGQCDSIYSTFVIASIYYILRKKLFLSMLFLGIAFAFKIQSSFILPFYFVLLLRGNIKWYVFLIIPIVYFISIIPAWFYGRTLIELFTIYLSQSDYFKMLTVYFPNIYVWINDDYYELVKALGTFLTVILTMSLGLYLSNKRFHFTFDSWIKLAFLSSIIVPFILPGMHERYLYLGDVIAVLYIFILKKNIHLAVGILFISFYSYLCCSRFKDILPLWPAFFLYSTIIILLVKDFLKTLKENKYLDTEHSVQS